MKLVNKTTGVEINVGDTVKTFRGESVTVTGMTVPHTEASTGRVYVKHSSGVTSSFFPGVIDAKFVEVRA